MQTENDAIKFAVERAARSPGKSFTVWHKDNTWYVCTSIEAAIGELVCIAQKWDADTVQIRYSGARSEWVKATDYPTVIGRINNDRG